MGKLLAGMLVVLTAFAIAAPAAGAAEIPPTGECVGTVRGLIAELPDLGEITEAEYQKADRGFIKELAASGCISDAKPLLEKVTLAPGSERCRIASSAADRFWTPHNARLRILDREWKRIGAPMQRRVWRLQARIRQLREAGASRTRINKVLQTRRAVGKKLHRYTSRLQQRAQKVLGPSRYKSFLVITELVAMRCIDVDIFGDSKNPGPAAKVIVKNYEVALLSLIHLAEDPGGEFAGNRYFLSLDLD